MQLTLEQYERIQNYLGGIMLPEEEKEFLIELDQNTSLKDGFEFEKDLRQDLASILDKKDLFAKDSGYYETDAGSQDYDSINSAIEKAGNEWKEENKKFLYPGVNNFIGKKPGPQKTKVVKLRVWAIITTAACIIVAVVSLVWFIPKASSPALVKTSEATGIEKDSNTNLAKTIPKDSIKSVNPQIRKLNYSALFKKYYAKDATNPQMPDLLAMVPQNYKNGDYSVRGINLDKIPLTRASPNDINSRQNILQFGHYYKGLSYIETNEYDKAVENLQWVIRNSGNKLIKIKAQWYIALIYLKKGENKKVTGLLFSLSGNDVAIPYNKEAADILKMLNAQD